jgi:hypothetical protein
MDGTENPKGLSSEGQASEGEAQGTSTKEARTYTEEELNKATEKAKNDALAAAGRDAKKLSDWEASLKAQQSETEGTRAEISKIQEQIDQAELEAARGDPAKLKELHAKKSYKNMLADLETQKKELAKQRQQLDRDKAETAETVKAAQQHQMETKVYEIAAKYDLNPEDLKAGIKDLNLTTVEQAEALAKRLGRLPEGEKKTTIPVSVPTSGGRHGEPTQEQLEKMSMEDYAAYVKQRDAKK